MALEACTISSLQTACAAQPGKCTPEKRPISRSTLETLSLGSGMSGPAMRSGEVFVLPANESPRH